jgi:hypothetical protein
MKNSLRLFCSVFAIALVGCTEQGAPVVEYVQIDPPQPRLGEVATVRFVARDYRGQPLAGANIGFRLKTEQPGATLTPTKATTIKGSGNAETQLIVTGRVTSVVVVASSPPCEGPCTGGELEVESPPISFAGATVPNQRQFTFQCGTVSGTASGGVHAIGPYDPTRGMIAGTKLKCYAHTADRNGDGVSDAQVSFLTEAGTIGPTETTKTDVIGNAEILFKTSNPIPKETEPVNWTWTPINDATHTGDYVAPMWMHPFQWTARPIISAGMPPNLQEPRRRDPLRKTTAGGNITLNVRDNLVTLIAVTAGEEEFTDVNNNGIYDSSEPFVDLTEPFVDSNDNGTWESDERYIDTNGNGTWDGKNGNWDGSSFIWVSERILWTGVPAKEDFQDTVDPIFRLAEPPPGPTPVMQPFDILPVSIQLCDPWLNSIAQNSDGDSCVVAADDEKSPVQTYPKNNLGGRALTYPSCPTLNFYIADSRDPTLGYCSASLPPCNRDPALTPIMWVAPIKCLYTSSPEGGLKWLIPVTTISGSIY